uniref:Conserved oligomeric Golgi complex subunit 1 n=1 Tax=Cacopsylla melanoneura TaxID=428564 RepID=A0A8D8YNK1_9HEMI
MSLLDVEPNQLFETHSVGDIEQIRIQIRHEIEKKKEELRVMVGERYRDLIDAADSITNMTVLSHGVIADVHEISSKCSNTRSSQMVPSSKPPITRVDTFAAQIKLLIDLNKQMWLCLDGDNVLLASIFYQYAFYIKTNVDVEVSHSNLLRVQWKTIAHFQNSIVKHCEKLLLNQNSSSTQTCECFLSLALIEHLNTQELLDRYIALRSQAVKNSFKLTEDSNIAKENILNSYEILLNTLCCIHENFYSNTGLLWTHAKELLQVPVLNLMKTDYAALRNAKHLPDSVHNYKTSEMILKPIDMETVTSKILAWLSSMKQQVELGVERSLKFVMSLKLVQDIHNSAHDIPHNLVQVVRDLCLPDSLNIWKEMYVRLIVEKAKHLILIKWSHCFDSVHAEVLRSIKSCNSEKNKESELDLRWYTWKESNADLEVHEKKSLDTHPTSGLLLKSHGYTPRVVSLCNSIQTKISSLDKDLRVIDQLNENQVLTKHQTTCCEKSIAKLVEFLLEQINNDKVTQCTCVLLARVCSCLTQFCPALQNTLSTSQAESNWNQVVAILLSCNHKAWDRYIVLSKPHYFAMFSSLDTSSAANMAYVLQTLAKWETVTIEDTQESNTEATTIQVPTQPGLALQESLVRFTSSLCRLSPSPYLRENLTREIFNFLLTKLTPLAENSLHSKQLVQRMNIQGLFDVKYLANVLATNQTVPAGVKQKITDFEKAIDVFDLEIIAPYLNENIDKCVGKTQCLLGVKSTHAHSSNSHVTVTSSANSCVVPLSKDVPWFPTLLLSNASQASTIAPLGHVPAKASKTVSSAAADVSSSLSASAKSTFFSVTEWFG